MNKFLWKVSSDCIDYTPVTVIRNAFTKQQAEEITKQTVTFSKTEFSEQHQRFAADNNPGCWRGFPLDAPDDVEGLSAENKELIINVINEAGKMYMDSWPQPRNAKKTTYASAVFHETDMDVHAWFNINDKGAANMIHNHHGALFSGVIYFQAEGTGPLRLYNDNFLQGYTHPRWPYKCTMFHEPEDGDLVLFPAYLLHDVPSNPLEKKRITCAFNVSPRLKDMSQPNWPN